VCELLRRGTNTLQRRHQLRHLRHVEHALYAPRTETSGLASGVSNFPAPTILEPTQGRTIVWPSVCFDGSSHYLY